MSYIRSTENPEKLYIFGNGENVEIHQYPNETWYIPQGIFNGLLAKYHRDYEEFPCKYRGLKIDYINQDGGFRAVLSYRDKSIAMWLVTWEYIARERN